MHDDQRHAAILYGSEPTPPRSWAPAPAPAPAAAPATAPDRLAAKIYDDPDDRLDESGLDKLHATSQRDIESAGIERLGLDPADAREAADEWTGVFRQYDIPTTDAAALTAIGLGVVAGGVEPDPIAWRNDARTALTQEFGAAADRALDDARRLVARDSNLAAWLENTGLGDHPRFVVALAKRARALRDSGRR